MLQGHFIQARSGQLFVTQFGQASVDNRILFLPSLFEEMNLSRAIVAKQAQYLALYGYAVYCLDYFGTGDSEGDLAETNAETMIKDVCDTVGWLADNGARQISLWGLRMGGMIGLAGCQDVKAILPVSKIVLWKPVTNARQFMTQFLRLKQASMMMQGAPKRDWRQEILNGELVEVAGYPLTATLLSSIDSMVFPLTNQSLPKVVWMEVASTSILPAISLATSDWNQDKLVLRHFPGTAFWQVPELFQQAHLHQPMLALLEEP
ncbi:hypothetical protein GCM10009092_37480 [Bowmanella denitrificans]|uniref:Serine aminopeptidase S33 domain-containing protein n=1 Tax=Bowmanella denitrificans TaxID=366582 RepID=A0ABP3HHC1_9ALTE